MAIKEIITDWTIPSGISTASVMYVDDAASATNARNGIAGFFAAMDSFLATSVSWTIRTSGKILDETTGTMTAVWNDTAAKTGVGSATGEPVADATQVLCRWTTGAIVGGRFLRGRTFIPGLSVEHLQGGNILPSTLGLMTDAAEALADNGFTSLVTWHRPKLGAGGTFANVTGGTVASELAILRRRRN